MTTDRALDPSEFDAEVRAQNASHAFHLEPGPGSPETWSILGVEADAALVVRGTNAELLSWRGGELRRRQRWDLDPWSRLDEWLASQREAGRVVAGYLGFEFAWQSQGRPGAATRKPRVHAVPDLYLCAYGSVRASRPAAQGLVPEISALVSQVPPESYRAIVRAAIERIAEGEIYQVNLSHPFRVPRAGNPGALYAALASSRPVPFGARFVFPGFELLGASPELLLSVRGRRVVTRPIKGTRPRGGDAASDQTLAEELLASAKDRAELTMIVDMERNDLGRVCRTGSVRVPSLCALESFPNVHHLVATVEGELDDGVTPGSLLRAAFPGGSVTGCPKLRALHYIREYEEAARGPYCGAYGVFRPDGSLDLAVGIRTAVAYASGEMELRSGAGITARSVPEDEWGEIVAKAAAFARLGGG